MANGSGGDRARVVALASWLAAAWLLWSGHREPLLLGMGVASIALVIWLSLRMNVVDAETEPYQLGWRPLVYLPWLLWEIVKSNMDVCRRILDPRLPIAPRMLRVRAGQHDEFGRVIYANSITLTPGTISTRLHEGEITVHALTREADDELAGGEMAQRVSAAVDPH